MTVVDHTAAPGGDSAGRHSAAEIQRAGCFCSGRKNDSADLSSGNLHAVGIYPDTDGAGIWQGCGLRKCDQCDNNASVHCNNAADGGAVSAVTEKIKPFRSILQRVKRWQFS